MRQGNGADLLGANHPRSATIGMIYVAPTDERESVLSAILTQEKIGRKQIVIVLPEKNIAFQKPVDFDGLKNMQRKLQGQIVVVAPSGSGPAEFAHRRNFSYFSSLDSLTRSLQMDEQNAPGDKGRVRRGRKSVSLPGPIVPIPPVGQGVEEPVQPQSADLYPSSQQEPENAQPTHEELEAGEYAEYAEYADPDSDDTLPRGGKSAAQYGWSAEEGDAGAENESEPGHSPDAVIPFPGRSAPERLQPSSIYERDTADLATPAESHPLPVIVPEPREAPTPLYPAGAAWDAPLAPAVSLAPGATGGRQAGTHRKAPYRRRSAALIALVILLVCVLILCSVISIVSPGSLVAFGNAITRILPGAPPSATIAITASTATVKYAYVIAGVTGTPDSTQRQVQARLLTTTTPTQSKTVPATGTGTIPATPGTGTLTFFHSLGIAQQVNASVVFPVGGETIHITANVTIPAAPPGEITSASVSAYADPPGHFGNILANAIDEYCCSQDNSISVRNLAAFSGGADAVAFKAVQQSDIDGVANPLKTSLTQQALNTVTSQSQKQPFVSQPQCQTHVTSDHAAGDHASSVTVSVSATCKGEVYDRQGAQTLAAGLLKNRAVTTLDPHYVAASQVSTSISQVTAVDGNGTVSITVSAQGVWVYQYTAAEQATLARSIAGKNKQAATAVLLQQAGIAKIDSIAISSGNMLPTDATHISFTVVNAPTIQGPGVSSSPTTPARTPTPAQSPSVGLGTMGAVLSTRRWQAILVL